MAWNLFTTIKAERTLHLQGTNDNYSFVPGAHKMQLSRVSKFSRVYKGFDSRQNPVVIKVLPEDLSKDENEVTRFRDETNWYGIHPGLIAPFDYIYQDGRHFLVSEYLPSMDICQFVKQRLIRPKTRIRVAVNCGLQLLDAVEVIHNKGMLHTDIKPSNVLFLNEKRNDYSNPQFRLIDFGLVQPLCNLSVKYNHGKKQPFVLVFSPPEQVLGFYELMGFHSDLYNIALLMYEIITGEPVYQTAMTVNIINLQTSFPLPENKRIPEPLMKILGKAASKYHFKKPPNHYRRNEVYEKLTEGILHRYMNAASFRNDLLEFWNNFNKA